MHGRQAQQFQGGNEETQVQDKLLGTRHAAVLPEIQALRTRNLQSQLQSSAQTASGPILQIKVSHTRWYLPGSMLSLLTLPHQKFLSPHRLNRQTKNYSELGSAKTIPPSHNGIQPALWLNEPCQISTSIYRISGYLIGGWKYNRETPWSLHCPAFHSGWPIICAWWRSFMQRAVQRGNVYYEKLISWLALGLKIHKFIIISTYTYLLEERAKPPPPFFFVYMLSYFCLVQKSCSILGSCTLLIKIASTVKPKIKVSVNQLFKYHTSRRRRWRSSNSNLCILLWKRLPF